ncbi:xaa-Pro aminopeptidase 1-like, partial [Tropilaelaps mercedesae]
SEYISSSDARLEFISGFTGSVGTAIVTEDQAALWTDGRYFKQALNELSAHAVAHGHPQWTLMKEGLVDTLEPHQWLSKILPAKGKIGIDPLLISFYRWESLAKKLEGAGHKLVPITHNLIDQVWDEKPSPAETAVEILPLSLAGRGWQEKLADVRSDLKAKNALALVITALDEIAWLFNLRGSDIEFNPVFFAYAVVTSKSAHLFVYEDKITVSLEKHLSSANTAVCETSSGLGSRPGDSRMYTGGDLEQGGQSQQPPHNPHRPALYETVEIQPYWVFREFLSVLLQQRSGRVWVSPKSSYSIVSIIPEERRILEESPIQLMKAVKNPTEIEGMKKAHIRDAAAMCEFMCWLEKEVPKGGVTEISAAEKLETFRRAQSDFVGLSFATISASGPNGAIAHYKPTKDSDRAITADEMYLVDSGGQYRDGTTDITRTVHFGTPTAVQRAYFTRVIKGVILLTTAKFPRLIKGVMIDTLGRKSLWDVGLDYMHGTGHGVGAYLNVHEGPFSISFRENPYDCGLREGMFSSIEPGYYKEDEFGIRTENVAVIVPAKTDFEKPFLTFETVTLVPVQSSLLDPSMLSKEEIEWINSYHEQCRIVVGKLLEETGKDAALQWLLRQTQPIG